MLSEQAELDLQGNMFCSGPTVLYSRPMVRGKWTIFLNFLNIYSTRVEIIVAES